jgi:benzoate-CoA ligase
MKRSILDYIAEHVRRAPGRVAIHYRDKQISYRELDDAVGRCRGALGARGVRPGERVALVMSDSPEMVSALLGVMSLGAIAVPCNPALPPAGLEYVFRDCGAKLAIVSPEHLETAKAGGAPDPIPAQELLRDAQPAPFGPFERDTPCLILYTSGSTGQPKGAVHRHGHVPCAVESVAKKVYSLGPDDRLFSAPRLFFAYGLGNSLWAPLGSGASTILVSERPTPALVAETFAKYRPSVFFAVPTLFRTLLEHVRQGNRLDTASLRFSVSAGEVLPPAVSSRWQALTGTEILESIGATELLYAFIHNYPGRNRPGSSGEVLDGYEVRLTDDQGNEVKGAGRGGLHVRGGSAISAYHDKPEKTAETIRDGWVRTGDVYRRDEDGYYWFEGRADDLFKCSGMWVSPAEVEEAVCRHPGVMEAAVIAAADAQGGTIPAAYVLLRQGYSPGSTLENEIKDEAAKVLPRYKRPQRIHFVKELPRTPTGKVQRFKLRQLQIQCSASGQ